jgi:hypothetical protein
MFGVNFLISPKGVNCLGYHRKSNFKKAPKFILKMARIFQQCTNCFEKESSVTTVAGLVKN